MKLSLNHNINFEVALADNLIIPEDIRPYLSLRSAEVGLVIINVLYFCDVMIRDITIGARDLGSILGPVISCIVNGLEPLRRFLRAVLPRR